MADSPTIHLHQEVTSVYISIHLEILFNSCLILVKRPARRGLYSLKTILATASRSAPMPQYIRVFCPHVRLFFAASSRKSSFDSVFDSRASESPLATSARELSRASVLELVSSSVLSLTVLVEWLPRRSVVLDLRGGVPVSGSVGLSVSKVSATVSTTSVSVLSLCRFLLNSSSWISVRIDSRFCSSLPTSSWRAFICSLVWV